MRINKFLTEANYCSRREADRLIEQGRVKINGKLVKLGDQVNPAADRVFIDGVEVIPETKKVYLAYHKPVGVITTTDPKAKDNIIKKLNYPVRVFPIGRLDVKTSGLILLTNDGEIVNKILKSKNQIEKEYIVTADRDVSDQKLEKLARGVRLDDGYKTLPAKVGRIGEKEFSLVIIEGKNRQVRRMCESLGLNVVKLKRVRIGNITLGNLKPGEFREIKKPTPPHYNTI